MSNAGFSVSDVEIESLLEAARRKLVLEVARQADDIAAPGELRDLAEALAALVVAGPTRSAQQKGLT